MITRATAALVIIGVVAPAAAEPPSVDVSRCIAFDAQALRQAIAREVPTDTRAHSFAVIVACPDLVTANLHVEPVPADGPIARSLDLGEVPGELRIKLLAVAIAELAEVASSLTPLVSDASIPSRPHVRVDPRDPQPLADDDPKSVAAPQRARTVQRLVATAPAAPRAEAISAARSLESRPAIEIGPSVGVRTFTRTGTTLLDVGVDVELPWFRVGLRGGAGEDRDGLGRLYPWIGTLAAARRLVCIGPGCALVRGEAGMAGVVARAAPVATATNASSLYAQGSLAVELHHRFGRLDAIACVDAGYAAGLIAHAQGRLVTSLAGFVATACIGAHWW